MCSRLRKWSALLAMTALPAAQAEARQLIDGAERKQVQVDISARETNQLSVLGREIVRVVPSRKGAIVYDKELKGGDFYFKLPDDSPPLGTVSLFVTDSADMHYSLILVPRAMPGEVLVIRPPRDDADGTKPSPNARAPGHVRRANELVLRMADASAEGSGSDRELLNQDVPLWNEARLVLKARHRSVDLIGEVYELTNVSAAEMVLAEQEFMRRGVRAVAIRQHTLAPGEQTAVYIVREP